MPNEVETNNIEKTAQNNVKIILNSENSQAIREAMDKMSAELMEKNHKLYERLAYK